MHCSILIFPHNTCIILQYISSCVVFCHYIINILHGSILRIFEEFRFICSTLYGNVSSDSIVNQYPCWWLSFSTLFPISSVKHVVTIFHERNISNAVTIRSTTYYSCHSALSIRSFRMLIFMHSSLLYATKNIHSYESERTKLEELDLWYSYDFLISIIYVKYATRWDNSSEKYGFVCVWISVRCWKVMPRIAFPSLVTTQRARLLCTWQRQRRRNHWTNGAKTADRVANAAPTMSISVIGNALRPDAWLQPSSVQQKVFVSQTSVWLESRIRWMFLEWISILPITITHTGLR